MSSEGLRTRLFDGLARMAGAVASPRRLQLLDLLAQGEKNVETLARQTGMTVGNASAHLARLRAASLVETRQDGPYVYYRLADDALIPFLRSLEELARRRLAEVERLVRESFEEPERLVPIGVDALRERMRAGDVTVIDVRPEDEYRAGHIPGALSVPLGELEERLERLPRDREVVAYCRGPWCVLSLEAVAALRRAGISGRRLDAGLPDWRVRGLPVETETSPRKEAVRS
ncbi:MAG TPA: metalloregulator ArsR/SmtB family transcription factor [Gemmatimonadota bacterium]|nr:metalloregulator ArsR/SmtB family transcription factor [Gemmatimonadota bacterium]